MYYNKEIKETFINDYIRSRVVAKSSLTGIFNKTYSKDGMNTSKLNCREFLYTEEGKKLAIQYGYESMSYIDVISNKFRNIID